jgi:hypothetical protein
MCARCPARPGPGCGTGRSGRQVAGPVGGSVEGSAGDPVPGVFCCGLRVVSMDGSTSDVRETAENSEYFSRPPDGCRARGVSSGPLAGCSGVGDRGADRGELWPVHGRGADPRAIAGRTGCITARRGRQLLDGVPDPASWVDAGQGRRWRPPNISSLSRARARFGADPLHMLFEQVAGLLITRPSPQLRPRNSHRASTKYTHQPGRQQPATDLPGVGHLHPPDPPAPAGTSWSTPPPTPDQAATPGDTPSDPVMRHHEIIPTGDHQIGHPNRRVAAQINLRQGHWAPRLASSDAAQVSAAGSTGSYTCRPTAAR